MFDMKQIGKKITDLRKVNNMTQMELADTLPLLKPEQVEKIVDKVDVSKFHDISSFLPFMDSDALAEIAMEYAEQGDSVDELLPYLDEDDVTQLALKILRSRKK